MEHIFENSEWHEDRMVRKQLNEAYNAMDEMRIRVQVQSTVIQELKARVDALEKLHTVSRALAIARDVMVAQETTLSTQRLALERLFLQRETTLQREMSVRDTGVCHDRSSAPES
jgi:hypothetical protein